MNIDERWGSILGINLNGDDDAGAFYLLLPPFSLLVVNECNMEMNEKFMKFVHQCLVSRRAKERGRDGWKKCKKF